MEAKRERAEGEKHEIKTSTKNFNGFSLPIALAVGDVSGYCVLSNHCHIQILDVSQDLLNGFVSGLPFSSPSPPPPPKISSSLAP